MKPQSAHRAIKAALLGNWDEAIEYNLQLLKDNPQQIEALNRLARAYAAIGQTKNAQKTWHKVLRLDPYNSIALGQLEKIKSRPNTPVSDGNKVVHSAQIFLDEPGKTRTTQLVRLASPKTLSKLEPGQPVNLTPKRRSVTVITHQGECVGSLPDDLALHLVKLIHSGNKYIALIRRVEKNSLHLFIKEVKRAKRYLNTPSFSSKPTKLIAIEPDAPITESPIDIAPTGEEESYQ